MIHLFFGGKIFRHSQPTCSWSTDSTVYLPDNHRHGFAVFDAAGRETMASPPPGWVLFGMTQQGIDLDDALKWRQNDGILYFL